MWTIGVHPYALALLLLLMLAEGYGLRILNRELKRSHPDTWGNLNKPAARDTKPTLSQWQILVFIVGRKYKDLHDKRISRIGDSLLLCAAFNFVVFLYLARFGDFSGPPN